MDKEFVDKFLKTLYMDDNINGGDDVNDAFACYKKSKYLMETAGFMLRKWCSNNKEVVRLINAAEADGSEKIPESGSSQISSVLGLKWNTESDEIVFDFLKIIHMMHLNEATKRVVLSVVASFLTHSGFCHPSPVKVKLYFNYYARIS